MKIAKIYEPNSPNYYLVATEDDIEFVNPIEHTFISLKQSLYYVVEPLLKSKGYNEIDIALYAEQSSRKQMQEYFSTNPSPELFKLLGNSSKKDQIKLLKEITLTTNELTSFIFRAYIDYNFTFSSYSAEHLPNGLENSKLPILGNLKENGDIHSIGETDLTDGQIKSMINQRNVVVSKFIDKGDEWHCFFLTYRSYKGEESHPSHMHYISNNWGLTREHVLNQLRSKRYSLPPMPHIDFERNS